MKCICKSSCPTRATIPTRLQPSEDQDQDGSVQRLCNQHTAIRRRDVDHVCQARKASENLPHEKHPPHPGKVPNTKVLSCADLPSMFTLLRQRRLRWLGHFHRFPEGHIPRDLLYGELASGKCPTERPQLRYRDDNNNI